MYIKHGSVTATRTPVLPVYTRILVQYIGYSLLGNSYKPPLFFYRYTLYRKGLH